ncbi:MFS transporter [Thermodesulfovibrio sp. 1176]|uniref:MFS transporter n=1 Tax=Thermodesulfovibrio sp. 1176 TaxID=3043424 RepID=UPI0024825FDF|nr:MFS transporter [Thermodesulfovibrio sp. 1176]MDI1471506.1 MFS transporter [Thermodesulfovibrio sp. 1176]
MKLSPFMLLCITGLFAIFSSTISKSPVLPLFATHLGAGPSEVGIVASVSAFTGIIASIPAGILSDRLGRRRMLFFSLIVFSTAPFLYILIDNIWQLALVRFYHGFATAIFVPVAMALVADLFHKERGEKMGWFSTATLIGRFMAPIAGGTIIGALVFNPGLSYKIVYLICGLAGIIALILTFRLPSIDKKFERQKWKETFSSFKSVLSNRLILTTAGVEAGILFAYGTFETFLPIYSIKSGLTAYEVGICLSAQIITLAFTKPAMGRFSDKHGRKPQIFWGALLGALCISSFSLFKSFFPILLISILFGLSLSIVTSATSAFIADLSKSEARGSAMGILGSVMDIGHTIGPLLSGIVAIYFGIEKAFIAAGVVLLTITFVFFVKVSVIKN